MLAQSKRRKSFLSIKSTTMGHLGAKGTGLLGLSAFCIGEKNKKGLWGPSVCPVHFYFFCILSSSQRTPTHNKQSICDNIGQLCHRRENDRTHTHAHFTRKCSLFCRKIMTTTTTTTTTTRKEEENKEEERRRRRRRKR